MSNAETIHATFVTGELTDRAGILSLKHDVHELAQKLKQLYEGHYGATGFDSADWHWQATALKNITTAAPSAEPVTVSATLVEPKSMYWDPHPEPPKIDWPK